MQRTRESEPPRMLAYLPLSGSPPALASPGGEPAAAASEQPAKLLTPDSVVAPEMSRYPRTPPAPSTLSHPPGGTNAVGVNEEKTPVQSASSAAEKRGFVAGFAAAKLEIETANAVQEKQLLAAVEALEKESRACFSRIEPEVVALSLEIATRVLGHEAQIDRLFLSGAVRLVLERMQESADVVLHVAPADDSLWRGFFAEKAWKVRQIRIKADPSVSAGMCICRSGGALLDFSVKAQMEEIALKFRQLLVADGEMNRGAAGAGAGEASSAKAEIPKP